MKEEPNFLVETEGEEEIYEIVIWEGGERMNSENVV